jgi:hypothetical protein
MGTCRPWREDPSAAEEQGQAILVRFETFEDGLDGGRRQRHQARRRAES